MGDPPFIPPELESRLDELARAETGAACTVELITVWERRIHAASGVAPSGRMPLVEFLQQVERTAPPPGMFGAPHTMGELLRLLQITEQNEVSPAVLAHAKNRLAVVRTTDGYKRLRTYAEDSKN